MPMVLFIIHGQSETAKKSGGHSSQKSEWFQLFQI